MISYHGHRLARRTRFSIVVNSAPAHSRSLSPSLEISAPSPRIPCERPMSAPSSRCPPSPSPNSPSGTLHASCPPALLEAEGSLPPLPLDDRGWEYKPVTPPPSSQPARQPQEPGARSASQEVDVPGIPAPLNTPLSWATFMQRVNSHLDSDVSLPSVTPMSDTLLQAFTDHLESIDRSSPLYLLRYTYDAETKTLITRCMPVPEHDTIQGVFEEGLIDMSHQHNLTRAERHLFAVRVGTDVNAFEGPKEGSRKRADLSVYPQKDRGPDALNLKNLDTRDVNGDFPSIAVEVGFSEGYEQLKNDMELWLLGSGGKVRVVVLVNLNEAPIYNGEPFTHFSKASGVVPENWVSEGPFGPILFRGHTIVGEITGVVELWRLDPTTGTPRMTSRNTVLPAPLVPGPDDCFKLTLADFFGSEARVPTRLDPQAEVPFEFDTFRLHLARSMREHGRQRLVQAAVNKRAREGEDPECAPGEGSAAGASKKRKA